MQDYNYMFHGCLEFTIEVSCDKHPHSKTLVKHWNDNYPAILSFLMTANSGIKGLTTDCDGKPVCGSSIYVRSIFFGTYS